MDNSGQTGVMIALLPTNTEWCHILHPHLTLVYAGDSKEIKPTAFNELGKDVLEIGRQFAPQTLDVLGLETMGEGTDDSPKVDVLLLRPSPDLLKMRSMVEHWNASKFPFRPHCTIGPVGCAINNIPSKLIFDRAKFAWGSEGFRTRLTGDQQLTVPEARQEVMGGVYG